MILAETFLSPFVDLRVTVVEEPFTAFLGALITTFLPDTLAVATFLEAVVAVTTAAFVAGLAAVAVKPTFTVLLGATTTVFCFGVILDVPTATGVVIVDFVVIAEAVGVFAGTFAVAVAAGVSTGAGVALDTREPSLYVPATIVPSLSNLVLSVLPSFRPEIVNVTESDSSNLKSV